MSLKKNNNAAYILTAIIGIVIFAIYFSSSNNKLYGNSKDSIEEVIRSIEGYESESIEILEIEDINNERIVGFLCNNSPAYIEFSKNQKGNYQWSHIEKSKDQSFASYIIHLTDYESTISKFMIITNEENDIARIELGVNEQVIEQELSVNKKAVTWIDLPKSNEHRFDYKYYDKDNNLVGDY